MRDEPDAGKRKLDAGSGAATRRAAPMPSLAGAAVARDQPPVRFDSQVGSPSTTAGTRWRRFADLPQAGDHADRAIQRESAIAWNDRPISASTGRSTRIAAASMAASTAMRGRPTPISAYSPGLDFETKLIFKPDAASCWRRSSASRATCRSRWRSAPNTDPYQPMERTLQHDPRGAGGAGTTSATRSPSSPSRPGVLRDLDILARDGEAQPGACLPVGHHAGCRAGAADGAARRDAGAAAARRSATLTARRGAGRRAGGADDPGAERRRAGEDPRGRRPRRRTPRRLRAAAAAARDAADVRGMARGAFPRPRQACAEPDPRDAFRCIERCAVPSSLCRPGRVCRSAAAPLRPSDRQWGLDEAREGLDCGRFAVPDDGRQRITEAQMSLF